MGPCWAGVHGADPLPAHRHTSRLLDRIPRCCGARHCIAAAHRWAPGPAAHRFVATAFMSYLADIMTPRRPLSWFLWCADWAAFDSPAAHAGKLRRQEPLVNTLPATQ